MVKNENEIHPMSRGKVMTNANVLDGGLSLRSTVKATFESKRA